MGKWAKSLFGQDNIGDVGIVLAGTITPDLEKEILGFFDEVVHSKDSVFHCHLVKKNGKTYPIVSNVYGAPAMVDILMEMHDGGCRNIIFAGYAYGGFKNLDIGSFMIPVRSYHYDGIFHLVGLDKKFSVPDKELQSALEKVFEKEGIDYVYGNNISVPSITFQLPHDNQEYRDIDPLTCEMELSSCYARAKEIGMRAVGVLVISDNRTSSIGDVDVKKIKRDAKRKVLEGIINNLESFSLNPLKQEKEFVIDEHLANIIHDPNSGENVYRDGGK